MTGMSCRHWRGAVWAIWVVAALLLLDVLNLTVYDLKSPWTEVGVPWGRWFAWCE